jgi:predicted transposase/invertase (TIGR01784 family)
MGDYIKPYSDIFIKYLFGSETNKALLLSFINAVLAETGFDRVVNVELRNPFNVKNYVLDKESILDVKATDEGGRTYNIEVQVDGDESFVHRSLYYWARVYANQLENADFYSLLRPVICIDILHFELLPSLPNYFNCFLLEEKSSHKVLTDHLVISFIELPKPIQIDKHNDLTKLAYFQRL